MSLLAIPYAVPAGIVATGLTGIFGLKYISETIADSWALKNGVSLQHPVRVGAFKSFYYDDVKRQLVIYQPLKQGIFIPYDEVAGYNLRVTGQSTGVCSVNTLNKSRPLVQVGIGKGAIEIINARMLAHIPHLQRIS
uniref:Uncharacterized protein n=1 Tax=Acetobacter pasteurianus TaxID=438 RepID=I3W061_ACEPA|nr:hypothetical protein [Acetobacter pasteurianus]AFK88988.1 hypothetical protein [Acetobacter pasteurianus]